jgi:hypothetical protein
LTSAKAFSAFFALPSAVFCDFSAFALAAAAASYAFCEARSSASSDAIRAFAVARAATKMHSETTDISQRIKSRRKAMAGNQIRTFGSFGDL